MEQFSKAEFLRKHGPDRATLCRDLAHVLSERLGSSGSDRDFHRKVQALVAELRLLGHDLWSFDESDDMEAWCPDWHTPTGPGIVVTFRPGAVEVEWSDH